MSICESSSSREIHIRCRIVTTTLAPIHSIRRKNKSQSQIAQCEWPSTLIHGNSFKKKRDVPVYGEVWWKGYKRREMKVAFTKNKSVAKEICTIFYSLKAYSYLASKFASSFVLSLGPFSAFVFESPLKNDVLNVDLVQVLTHDVVKWHHGSILCVNNFQPMTAAYSRLTSYKTFKSLSQNSPGLLSQSLCWLVIVKCEQAFCKRKTQHTFLSCAVHFHQWHENVMLKRRKLFSNGVCLRVISKPLCLEIFVSVRQFRQRQLRWIDKREIFQVHWCWESSRGSGI